MRKIYIICIAVITMSLTSCLPSARLYILNATDDHILVEVKTIYQVSSDKLYDVHVTYDGLMAFKYKEESSFGPSIALAPIVIKPSGFARLVWRPANSDILYSMGFGDSFSRDEDGKEFIDMDKIIKALDTVFIEGHTDNNFYKNPILRGNWGLSAMRAISVWQFWAEDPNQASNGLNAMKNHIGEALFSVSGYGDTRPRNEAKNCEKYDDICHSKNRRIDIRITVKKPSIKELEEIKGK